VLIDGAVGARVAPGGRLLLVLRPTIVDGRIVAIDAVADPDTLASLVIDELPA
jgi:RNA polymerase sigma-70 factor (ECF subfamily)